MSRLGNVKKGKDSDVKRDREFSVRYPSMAVIVGAVITLILALILVLAASYSMITSNSAVVSSGIGDDQGVVTVIDTTTTKAPTTSTILETTTIKTSTTSTLPPTTTSSTTTSTSSTSTTELTTTTSTLSKYQIADCMAGRMDRLYLGENSPSYQLESYLGQYTVLFPTDLCRDDEKMKCQDRMKDFWDDGRLRLGITKTTNPETFVFVLPVVEKDGLAYAINNPKSFEELLGCGTLN